MYAKKISASELEGILRTIHGNKEEFEEGDLLDRLYNFNVYELQTVPLHETDFDSYAIYDDIVERYILDIQNKLSVFPPVINKNLSIIDGAHRINAYLNLGLKEALMYVGKE